MFASLARPDDDTELHWLEDGHTRCTTGSVVSSLYHLKDPEHDNEDAGFFVFPDLSIRNEGSYRLKLSLFEVVGANVLHCKSIHSAPFYVYTAKQFPSMEGDLLPPGVDWHPPINQGRCLCHRPRPTAPLLLLPPHPPLVPPQQVLPIQTTALECPQMMHLTPGDSTRRPRPPDQAVQTGFWAITPLVRLGAGSMGKVKLATHNITGEKLAVKILPRVQHNTAAQTNGATGSAAKQASKDASKEIRTLREAALSMLLHHPYICGMREMIVHQHHFW